MLEAIRDVEATRPIWADSICINQAGDSEVLRERAQQIEMMDLIFSRALVVLVYLGESPPAMEDFLSAAEALSSFATRGVTEQMTKMTDLPVGIDLFTAWFTGLGCFRRDPLSSVVSEGMDGAGVRTGKTNHNANRRLCP